MFRLGNIVPKNGQGGGIYPCGPCQVPIISKWANYNFCEFYCLLHDVIP